MIKKEISILTFGIFLIIVGAIGKILHWPQAVILLGLGLVFELLAVLMFVWNKIKQNE